MRLAAAFFAAAITQGVNAQSPQNGPAFGSFKTACQIDPITDTKTCAAWERSFGIRANSKGTWVVIIGASHAYNSDIIIRFDKTEPITGKAPGWSLRDATSLIDRMHQHQQAVIRYERIDQRTITQTVNLQPVPEIVRWLTENTRP